MSKHLFAQLDWQENAGCKGADYSIFFSTPGKTKQIRQALSLCETCPVRENCYEHALVHEAYGIWGGTTEQERVFIRKERGIPSPIRANADEVRSMARGSKEDREVVIEHGTRKGYQSHRTYKMPFLNEYGEDCGCKKANAAYTREIRRKAKGQ